MTAAAPDVVAAVPAPREPTDDDPARDAAAGAAAAPPPGRLARLVPRRRRSGAPAAAAGGAPARPRRRLSRRGAPAAADPAAAADAPAAGRLRRLLPGRRAVAEPPGTGAGAPVLPDLGARPGLAVRLSGPAVLLGAALVGAGLSAGLPELSGRGALLAPAGLLLARVALTLRSGRPLLSAVLSKAGVLVLLLAAGTFLAWSYLPPPPTAPAPAVHAPATPAPALPVPEVLAGEADPLQQQLQDLQRRLAEIEAPPP